MDSESFMAHQDHRSRLVQWLTDEFYNWARQLPDEKLAYLHEHFEAVTSLPLGDEAP
jgi:hypothetical protein